MPIKEGWTGRVYEDFEVDDIYVHPLGRTVLSVDNSWFTLLTQNTNPIHFDHAYAAQTEFGRPLVDSTFTLALVTGQSVIDLSLNVMANLGWDEVRLPNPVFEGDTDLFAQRGAGKARIEITSQCRHRAGEDHRIQSGRNDRDRVHPHVHGLQTWPRARHRARQNPRTEDQAGHMIVRDLDVAVLGRTVARLLVESNYTIPPDVLAALRDGAQREQSELGRATLEQLIRNYEIAAAERVPVCQDSGMTVVILETGQDVHWVGGSVQDAIYAGIREGTQAGYLRWSVTGDPTRRLKMRGDDTPGVIHLEMTAGDRVRLTVASKGFGAENMSALRMFVPADGDRAMADFVVDTVDRAGANACPPIIVGVGVGGTFEMAALLAKKAVLRPLTVRHARPDLRELESSLLERVNALGIGPQGLGGVVTALAVNVEVFPTHIAGLPVAVNLGCHSMRRATTEL